MHGNTTHGYTRRYHQRHELYGVWDGIKGRCLNPRNKSYPRYGGRGITICERWRTSFQRFIEDMGPRPTPQHSIDRFPNQDGNYEPGNCRWATPLEQYANSHPRFALMTDAEKVASQQRIRESARKCNEPRRNPSKTCQQCGQPYRRQGYSDPRLAPKFCSAQCYQANLKTRTRDAAGRFA